MTESLNDEQLGQMLHGTSAQLSGSVTGLDNFEQKYCPPNELLNVAIGKARVEFEQLTKSAEGMIGQRTFNYAPLGDMVRVTERALAKHDVGFVMPMTCDNDTVVCELIVQGHGGMFRTSMMANVPKPTDKGKGDKPLGDTWIQELGRITTYLRRYLFNSFWGLDTVEDKDSDGVQPRPAAKQRDEKAETPAQREAAKESAKPPVKVGDAIAPKNGADLKEALNTARKNLGWSGSDVVAFIGKHFPGLAVADMTEAHKAQLLGMMEDLYAAKRDGESDGESK